MTTKIHIVNYGPGAIQVDTPNTAREFIFAQQSNDYYVYDEHDVVVKEVKESVKKD